MRNSTRSWREKVILFLAEGLGSGRFPVAPGTIGTLVGFVWIYMLLLPGSLWIYIAGVALGYCVAVWLGTQGEKILGTKDPGSIVIDEIAALPVAFLGAVLAHSQHGIVPQFAVYLSGKLLVLPILAFAGFRFFDIAKPGLIGRSQNLPAGWGLVTDDYLAAIPVGGATYVVAHWL